MVCTRVQCISAGTKPNTVGMEAWREKTTIWTLIRTHYWHLAGYYTPRDLCACRKALLDADDATSTSQQLDEY